MAVIKGDCNHQNEMIVLIVDVRETSFHYSLMVRLDTV